MGRPGTWKKGQSGNPKGKPKDPFVREFHNALRTTERKKRKKFLVHLWEEAWDDNKLAASLAKKLVPDKQHIEAELTVENNVMPALTKRQEAMLERFLDLKEAEILGKRKQPTPSN